MKKSLIGLVFTFAAIVSFAQQDSIKIYAHQIFTAKTDAERRDASSLLKNYLYSLLQNENFTALPKDTIPNFSSLTSADEKLRLFTWFVPLTNGTYEYYGCIYYISSKKLNIKKNEANPYIIEGNSKKNRHTYIISLVDRSNTINTPENKKLDQSNWYGAFYYKLIQTKNKKETFYTLLGWKGNNLITQKKVVEVLRIQSNGRAVFNGDFVYENKKTKSRLVFEYSAKVSMSLKYDEAENYIVMDHLSPPAPKNSEDPDLTGQYQFYGPDFSYDALFWKKGSWYFLEKYDARNPKDKRREKLLKPKPAKSDTFYKPK